MGRIIGRVWRVIMTLALTASLSVGLTASPALAADMTHQVTNVGDKSFTVTWISDSAEVGQVKWGTTAEGWDTGTQDDDRGASTSDDTHHVTVSGLAASTTYYYKIISGGVTYDNGGAPYEITTGPTLSFKMPLTLISGTVFLADGQTPANGAIVYLQIDPPGSQILSEYTNANGYWAKPIDAIRTANFQSYYAYTDPSVMALTAQGGSDGSDSAITTVGTAKTGAPDMTLTLGPSVTNTVPDSDATNVAVDSNIVITFSTTMDEATTVAAFSIDPDVAGTKTLVGDTLTFDPTADLATDTSYTVTIAATAEDTDSKTMTAPHVFSFSTLDTTMPADPTNLQSTSHTAGAWSTDNTIVVTWTDSVDPGPGSTGLDGYSVLWDANATTTPDTTKDIEDGVETLTSDALADGTWYFHISAVDVAGNWQSTAHLGPFFIDTTAPTMETIAEAAGGYHSTAPTFSNFGFDDNLALNEISVQLDAFDGAWTSVYDFADGTMATEWNNDGMALPGFDALVDGPHTIYFMVTDQAGNSTGDAGSLSWAFNKDTVAPPDPADIVSTSHTVGEASSDATIDITWTDPTDPDPASGVDGYSIEWSNASDTVPDQVIDIQEGVQAVTSDSLAAGDWWFHLRTADVAGNWTSTVHLGPFIVSAPLVVDFSAAPTAMDVGRTVQFNNLTTGGVPPLTYAWDFDNDTVVDSTAQSPTYAYPTAGTYTVKLTVTDNEATSDTETKIGYITVSPAGITHRVTNVGDKSFTISWYTDTAATGQVKWGMASDALTNTADDDRGASTSDDTHHVSIDGLAQNTLYYYEIISGGVTYNNDGVPYEVTTGPTLDFTMPDIIETTVYKDDGTTPAEGTIVYARIGDSQWLSGLAAANGICGIDISASRTADLQAYDGHTESSTITLDAQGAADGSGLHTGTIADVQATTPEIVLQIGPRVISTIPANNAVDVAVDTNIEITFSADMDPTTTEAAFSIDPMVAGAFSWAFATELTFNPTANLAADTVYTVTIAQTAKDVDERLMMADYEFSFGTDDTTPPNDPSGILSSHVASAWSTDNTVQISWTDSVDPVPGTGLDGYSVLWDANATATPNTTKDIENGVGTITSEALADGTWYFHIRPVDNAGNWGTTTHRGPYYIDTTAPTMEAITEAEGQYFNAAPVFANFGFDDNLALNVISVQMDSFSGAWSTLQDFADGTTTAAWDNDGTALPGFETLSEGTHTVYFKVTDQAGNSTGSTGSLSWQFYKDTVAPPDPADVASTSHNVGAESTDTTVVIIWTDAVDPDGVGSTGSGLDGYSVEWSNAADTIPDQTIDVQEGVQTTTSSELAAGDWWFHLRTADSVGNWTSPVHLGPFTIVAALDVDFSANLATVDVGQEIQFTNLSTGGVTPFTYEWDFGDGSAVSSLENPGHTYNEAGTYTISLTVTDDEATSLTESKTDYITVNPVDIGPVVTNIGDKQFTVTWVSDAAETGQVKWGTAADSLINTAEDGRGASTSDDTLHVTITGLSQNTTYYFAVVSGGVTYTQASGSAYAVATGPTLGAPNMPEMISGKVYQEDGTTPAEGAIVYLQIGAASSQWLSALTDVAGTWGVDIANIRDENLQDYYTFDNSSPMFLDAVAGADGGMSVETTVGIARDPGPLDMTLVVGPRVTITVPARNAQDVEVTTNIVATFSAEMNESTAEAAFSVSPAVAGSFSWDSTTMTFNPTASLSTDTVYTVTIATTAEDLEGRPMATEYSWQFTTEDTVPPTGPTDLQSTSHTASQWSKDNTIDVTWTAAVDPAPGTGLDGYGIIWDNIATTAPAAKNTGAATVSAASDALADGTWYLHIRAVDKAGNWGTTYHLGPFQVDSTPPQIAETSPAVDAETVPLDSAIVITFDDEMEHALTEAAFSINPVITGTFSWGSPVLTFTPDAPLEYSTVYTVTIDTGATDKADNTLAENYVWSFATPVLGRIDITPANPTVALGLTQQFTATGVRTDESTIALTDLATWASSNDTRVTIDPAGLATTLQQGPTVISASYTAPIVGEVIGRITMTVGAPVLTGIRIEPADQTIALGRTQQFATTGVYSDLSEADLSSLAVYSSSDEEVATINAAGLANSLSEGTSTIGTTYGTFSDETTLTVGPAEAVGLVITPDNPRIALAAVPDNTVQFTATIHNSDGSTEDVTADAGLTWESGTPAVADFITATEGEITTTTQGSTVITATLVRASTVSDTTTLNVTAPTLQTVTVDDNDPAVDGTTPAIAAGDTVQLDLTGTYSDNWTQNLTAGAIWSSSNRSVATVSGGGLVTAVAKGTAIITANRSGERDTIIITVTSPPTVAASGASEVGDDSATLNGNLADIGSATTVNVSFEWGLVSGALDQETEAEAVTATGAFSATLDGTLTANTTYYFRAKAVGDGTGYSAEQSFKTGTIPPVAITSAAADVTGTTATLNGSLDDLGTASPVDVSFEWGETTAYGNTTATAISMAATGDFDAAITGLDPSTTYHFRARAAGDGVSYGADMTFTTETVLVSIKVTPSNVSTPDGMTKQFTATGTYSNNTTRNISADVDVTWSSLQALIASIDADGLATGESHGTATIQAQLGTVTGSTTLNVTAPVLTAIDVTPAGQTIAAGKTQQFTAIGTYSNGTTGVNVTTGIVRWASSDTAVASINASGLATSYNEGTTAITATGNATGSTTLTVGPAVLDTVTVTPVDPTIPLGTTQQFRAMGTYSDGTVTDITATADWTSETEATATVDTSGLATSIAQGSSVITATLDGKSATSTLSVIEATLDSIALAPATPSVAAGKTQQFTATGTYSDTSEVNISSRVAWSSNNTAVAVVNASGLVTTYVPGTATITASLSGKSNQATITVTGPVLDSVVVTPANPVITFVSGNPPVQQFTATGVYSDGSTANITATAVWASSNTAVAEDPAAGMVTIKDPGTTQKTTDITATSGAIVSTSATLTVLPDTVAPVVRLTSPAEGMILSNKTLTVSGSVDDTNVTTLEAIINGDTTSPVSLLPLSGNTFSQGVLLNTGSNTVLVRAIDGSENTGKSRTVTVEVNPNKPTVTLTSPAGDSLTNNPSVTIAGTITNATSATLILNGQKSALEITGGAFSASKTLSEGTNVIVINAYTTGHAGDEDYLGTSGVAEVKLDTTAPVVDIGTPTSGSVLNTAGVTVSGTVNDPGVTSALLVLNGAAPQQIPVVSGTFSQTITLEPGANSISVIATDAVGNTSSSSSPTTVTFDNTKPKVTITSPANRAVVRVAGQKITGTVEDPSITQASLIINGGTPQTISVAPNGSFSKTVTLLEGANTIEARATDAAMNTGTSGVVSVTVDITPPALSIGLSDPTDSITITVTSNETLQGVPSVSVIGPVTMTPLGVNTWSGTYGSNAAPIAAGDYTVTVAGTDIAGNQKTKTATFAKEQISVNGIDPTTVSTDTTTLEVETNGEVNNADISLTQHLDNPSGNVGAPSGAPTGAGAFIEIVASPALRDNLAQVYIRVDYEEEDLPAGTDESSLQLYVWDVATGVWEMVPGSSVNTEENYVYGYVDHLSEFGGFGKPTPAPSPQTPVVSAPAAKPGVTSVVAKRDTTGKFTEAITATSNDAKVGITIGEGVTGLTSYGMPINEISAVPVAEPPAAPAEAGIVGLAYEIGPDGSQFDAPVTICFAYEPADIPAGISEEKLVIAFWDDAAAEWVELDNISVDTAAHLICGETTHFTTFAVLAHTSPAEFTVSDLTVSPSTVNVGQQVNVSVTVTNTGDLQGTYTVTLTVGRTKAGTKQVTLAGGASETVTFNVSRSTAGTSAVSVGGQSGSFTVRQALVPAKFGTSDLVATPNTVKTGETISVSVLVRNTGDLQGSYDVVLKAQDSVLEAKRVTLSGGSSQTVNFTTSMEKAGTYALTIGDLSVDVTVEEQPAPAPPQPEKAEEKPAEPEAPAEEVTPPSATNWLLIIIIGAAALAIILVAGIIVRRRRI